MLYNFQAETVPTNSFVAAMVAVSENQTCVTVSVIVSILVKMREIVVGFCFFNIWILSANLCIFNPIILSRNHNTGPVSLIRDIGINIRFGNRTRIRLLETCERFLP